MEKKAAESFVTSIATKTEQKTDSFSIVTDASQVSAAGPFINFWRATDSPKGEDYENLERDDDDACKA